MGIFRKDKFEPKVSGVFDNIDMCKTAIEYAKSFGVKLDYSSKSLKAVDYKILEYYSNDLSVSNPSEHQIWCMALIWGTYLGETLLGTGLTGFTWYLPPEEDIPILIQKNNDLATEITPIHKTYKRLVNGIEDSIVSFYDVMLIECR